MSTIPRALPRREPTEKEFTQTVLELLRTYHWRRVHFRPAKLGERWATYGSGDIEGVPDILAVRGHRLLAAELKVGRNKPTDAQNDWLEDLARASVECHVWRPADWDRIVETVR